MTVADNVSFGLRMRPRRDRPGRAEISRRAEELLSMVQLEGLGGRYPSQLSGGQRQRLVLARALAIEPRILLLDEPFGALDAKVRKELRRWLRDLNDRTGVTTVFVTHYQEEALDLADIVAVMNKGRIEQAGRPREIFDAPATAFVAEFIGGAARFDGEVRDGRFIGRELDVPAETDVSGKALAFIRPHDWTIVETGGLKAQVLNVLDAGPLTRLDCRTEAGSLLEVALPPGSAPPTNAHIQLFPETVRVFRAAK